VWEVATRQEVARLVGRRVQFSPDGRLLATSTDNPLSGTTVRLWDVTTWQEVALFRAGDAGDGFNNNGGLAFAPDGRVLASGAADGMLRLWDVAQKREIASRRGHGSIIYSVAFSPDGRRLATGGWDSTVKLWEVAPLQEVATFTGHHGPVYSVAFSPDGSTLATASADATVRLWQAPPVSATVPEQAVALSIPPEDTIRLATLDLFDAAQATLTAEGNVYRVDVTAVDGNDWHAQLVYLRFDDLQEGATYAVRFRAKADASRSIRLQGIIGEPDWHGIGLNADVPLTEDWKNYEFTFRAHGLAVSNLIQFFVGQRLGTVWIADFALTKRAN
jgi:hypothetical protein